MSRIEVIEILERGLPGPNDHTQLGNIGTNSHAALDTHVASTANPHSVTKAQVGLGNADNTSDAAKPVSTAQAAADALRVLKAGDTMTGPLNLPFADAEVSLGDASASFPRIDFKSSANVNDHDARIFAFGGAATNGQGIIGVTASALQVNGTTVSLSGHTHPFATSPTLPGWTTGRYYGVASSIPITGFSSVAMTANRHYGMPFYCPRARTVDRIGLEVVTAVASSTIRLAIYTMDTNGLPGTLVLDAGTVSSATVGVKEIAISQALAADTWYYLVIVSNLGPAIRYGTPATNVLGGSVAGSVQRHAMPHVDRANTTLVSPFGTPTNYNDQFLFLCDVRAA